MRMQKLFFSFGMVGTLSFLLTDFLGTVLWKGYNPATSYVSQLIADGAPNVGLTRTLFYLCEICLVIFFASLLIHSFRFDRILIRLGYAGLLLLCGLSLFGYGLFPMTMDFILNLKNYVHIAITIIILAGTICMLFLLAIGYAKQQERRVGLITLIAAVLFLFSNLVHLYAIFSGQHNLGLIQRLSLYTFQTYIFVLSWIYVNRLPLKNRYQ